ncbi:hypothetical protein QR680_008004 [Steinernema hermaphroditum]|uniref:Translation factor GUF1 homolog, mitochondrial n=1 Tax=Steinernema hermaphroditum TaxID=289476 RepID=A0AA39IF03_9BILA|nr:hypothetical protein QR680_008004 [Steinernema hermaphroditum]
MDPHEPMLVDPVPAGQPQQTDDLAHLATQHGDGRLVKMDVDYTKQVDEALPKASKLLEGGNVTAALESLAPLEKQSRLGSDMKSNARILEHMVKMCFEAKNWQVLNDTILVLSKKRSLIKFAIAKMVRACVEMVDKMPTEEERNKLIETLRAVTAGKIYVEVDRARLTQRLVKKLESEGKLNEACEMLLELQVETYGSMQMQEKIEYLLEQMRLSVARKDFIRASIIAKKISTRFFDAEDKKNDSEIQDLKLKYYDHMVKIGVHEEAFLDVCRYYRAMFETPKIKEDEVKSALMLKHAVLFVLLSPHDNEQWQLLHLIHRERKLEDVPVYKKLLELFIGEEIISWRENIIKNYEIMLRRSPEVQVFTADTEAGEKRFKAFQARVGEHNIRMVSKYYTQITFDRMSELLDYDVNEMETFLCNLIVTGVIPDAKIDRKERIINMRARKANVEHLDQWGHSVNKLTDILNKIAFSMRCSNERLVRSNDPLKLADLERFTPDKIRNFGIVAHVDHGKSTLADRLLQLTNVIDPDEKKAQFLDKLQVERERGITVKAQSCSMIYKGHLLNLIDTPGHADFSFEVSRSLAACNGILLLVAANQGIQAQTMANFWMAFEHDLKVLPVISKIDLTEAKIPQIETQLKNLFDFGPEEIIRISAKSGFNVPSILDAIVERIEPPTATTDAPFRALIFDSWFDHFRGAIACVLVTEGALAKGQMIRSFNNQKEYEVLEVGIMHPDPIPCKALHAGQVGYVICNMKTVQEASVGETLFEPSKKDVVVPFPGFKKVKPTVYAGLYPVETSEYEDLKQAVERLCLNDSSVTVTPDSSPALGLGWRVGFLGVLHMEVFGARLSQEYDANVILTAPNVEYQARIKDNATIRKKRYHGKGEITILDPGAFPDPSDVEAFLEPMVKVTIVVPSEYMGTINGLCSKARGQRGEILSIDDEQLKLEWRLPLAEVITDFFEQLKRLTSGYASFDYEHDGYDETNLVKLSILINGRSIDEFSQIVPAAMAQERAKKLVRRLKEEIPQQQYEVQIKCTVGTSTKALSMATIKPMKRDFTGLLKGNFGGGGMERLNKKLSHQKKGKERMKMLGRVQVPKEAFMNMAQPLKITNAVRPTRISRDDSFVEAPGQYAFMLGFGRTQDLEGPLFFGKQFQDRQIGIAATRSQKGAPDIFTRLSSYCSWISHVTKGAYNCN